MNLSKLFKSSKDFQLDKSTFVNLRWIALLGQFATINIVKSSKNSKKIKKDSQKYQALIEEEKLKINIQRFKGLGEMNPEELWSTTLNPETRTLLKVEYSKQTKIKSKDDQKLIQTLMGNDVTPRKDFIISRALDVSNLDI